MGIGPSQQEPRVSSSTLDSRFDERELGYLRESFRDLAARGGDKRYIDAGTFRRAFDLPGLVGDRLFAVFSRGQPGVDLSAFVGGLAIGLRVRAPRGVRKRAVAEGSRGAAAAATWIFR